MRMGGGMGSLCVFCKEPCVRGVNVFTDDGEAETCFDEACAEDEGDELPPHEIEDVDAPLFDEDINY
jgi:hypothetical protein